MKTKHCGSCVHCDQFHSGFKRWCDVKGEYVNAHDAVCGKYVDTWEMDLFGNFPNAEKLGIIKQYRQ